LLCHLKAAQLKKIILASKKISQEDYVKLVAISKQLKSPVEQILIGKNIFTENELGSLIAEEFSVEFVDLDKVDLNVEVMDQIPKEVSTKKKIVAFEKGRGALKVALSNPNDLETLDFIRKRTGYTIKPFFSFESEIDAALRMHHGDIQQAFIKIIEENAKKSKSEVGKLEDVAQKLPAIKIVDTIIEYAVNEQASDIHIEPLETEVLIRYRVDGQLKDITTLPKNILPVLVARLKILANLKIDEHRLPQDGRIKTVINNSKIALRVSILPIFFGEKVVMRVLEESSRKFSLEDLGVDGNNFEVMKSTITKPHGMVLVTGPTGSGKTTTLYTVMNILNTTTVNINTIEDPIEYSMPRINQTQVKPNIGMTFAGGLRALLRQDPDIIMVGEIRDHDTVSMAINAAMTGHLVLSTLHTNSAAASIPRLIDMGVEPFLIATTLNSILAQRLVRKLCDDCKKKVKLPKNILSGLKEQLKKQGITPAQSKKVIGDGKFYQSGGCNKCGDKGFKGRLGIFEVLDVNEEIVRLITNNVTFRDIQAAALKNKMVTMLMDGITKAHEGQTTIEEVLAATKE